MRSDIFSILLDDSLLRDILPGVKFGTSTCSALLDSGTTLRDTGTQYETQVDMPGVEPDAIDIQVKDGVIAVQAERKQHPSKKFKNSFWLPMDADPDAIAAQLRNGVLTLTIPKPPEKQPKKITVTT